MRYVKARLDLTYRDEAYRNFIADMTRVAAMDIRGRDGIPRFYDLINGQDNSTEKDPEKIISRITHGINNL